MEQFLIPPVWYLPVLILLFLSHHETLNSVSHQDAANAPFCLPLLNTSGLLHSFSFWYSQHYKGQLRLYRDATLVGRLYGVIQRVHRIFAAALPFHLTHYWISPPSLSFLNFFWGHFRGCSISQHPKPEGIKSFLISSPTESVKLKECLGLRGVGCSDKE